MPECKPVLSIALVYCILLHTHACKLRHAHFPAQVLQKDDVLLDFDGVPIANDGTVPFRQRERIFFTYLITLKPTGSMAHVKVRQMFIENVSYMHSASGDCMSLRCGLDLAASTIADTQQTLDRVSNNNKECTHGMVNYEVNLELITCVVCCCTQGAAQGGNT